MNKGFAGKEQQLHLYAVSFKNCFSQWNYSFLGVKQSVSNWVETNYEIALLIMLNCESRKHQLIIHFCTGFDSFHHRGHRGRRGYDYLWIRSLCPRCLWWNSSFPYGNELFWYRLPWSTLPRLPNCPSDFSDWSKIYPCWFATAPKTAVQFEDGGLIWILGIWGSV